MEKHNFKVLPSIFAESTYLLDGKPFRLTNRYYLKEIYDGYREKGMIMSGRQVEKSTTNAVHIANHTLLIDNFKALYVAPLTKQVGVFSKERLGRLYRFSQNDIIRKQYMGKDFTDNVGHKDFANGSTNYLEHCFELGDNIRGISANGIWVDEIQDIHIDAIPVIEESQSHALESGAGIKVTQYTGTPKSYANTIQQYWDKSSQNEWVIRCPHCGQYQILGIKNMEPDRYVCSKCHMELDTFSRINGMWYPAHPDREFKGYRISQMMVPWVSAKELWGKYQTYSTAKFYNECLGRSYEDASKPFSSLLLGRISANDFRLYERKSGEFANQHLFMGVDWGSGNRSYTIVTIFGYNKSGQFQLVYAKKYVGAEEQDLDYQKEDIANLMNLFGISYAILDEGYGAEQDAWLKRRFGSRVDKCYYSFNLGVEKKYDRQKERWVVNRSQAISNYITFMKEMKIVWPGGDKSKIMYLFDHHMAEYAEYRGAASGKTEDLIFNHPEGSPDDGLHSCIYAYLASQLYQGSYANELKFGVAYGAR